MQENIKYIKSSLQGLYPDSEIDSFTRIILRVVCGFSTTDLLLRKNSNLSPTINLKIKEIVERLTHFEPIQYILGQADFMDFEFQVVPGVLIPRPETEELVDLIVRENRHFKGKILDLGTGSGCIAISLAKLLPGWQTEAWDVSPTALQCAAGNARRLQANVRFLQMDILNPNLSLSDTHYDILVSNPPYVCDSEKDAMSPNVLEHEPHIALFVPDSDPLIFYRTIALLGRSLLTPQGLLYFEINCRFGPEVVCLLEEVGYQEISLITDISGKDRIVRARNNPE